MTGPAPQAWWVVIERNDDPDTFVGPYPTQAAAERACEFATLVDELVVTGCSAAAVVAGIPPDGALEVLVDLEDPTHTGIATHQQATHR